MPAACSVLMLAGVALVEAEAWRGGIELQIECCCLDGLLLITSQPGEAVGKGIGNEKRHGHKHYGATIISPSSRLIQRDRLGDRRAALSGRQPVEVVANSISRDV